MSGNKGQPGLHDRCLHRKHGASEMLLQVNRISAIGRCVSTIGGGPKLSAPKGLIVFLCSSAGLNTKKLKKRLSRRYAIPNISAFFPSVKLSAVFQLSREKQNKNKQGNRGDMRKIHETWRKQKAHF